MTYAANTRTLDSTQHLDYCDQGSDGWMWKLFMKEVNISLSIWKEQRLDFEEFEIGDK